MRYLSLFSGIEAATLAWQPLGWEAMAFAEIEPFPSAVLAEHWPGVPNLGDVTTVDWEGWLKANGRPDVIVAGSPCQAFSVAGKRLSLEDARGNLSLFTAELVRFLEPRFFLWENVPGALSTKDNAFGCLLGELMGAGAPLSPTGKRWTNAGLVSGPEARTAWRVLDAQWFGVAQRRRRLFLVRCPRDGDDPAQVLLECEGVRRDSPPSREAGAGTAGHAARRPRGRGLLADTGVVRGLKARFGTSGSDLDDAEAGHLVSCMASGQHNAEICDDLCPAQAARQHKDPPIVFKPSHYTRGKDGAPSDVVPPLSADADKGDQDSLVLASRKSQRAHSADDCETWVDDGAANTLNAFDDGSDGRATHAVVSAPFTFEARVARNGRGSPSDVVNCLKSQAGETGKGDASPLVSEGMAVRRLTPRECERLQGAPDDHTRVPWRGKPADECPDGPRYRAIGNSMAVPVVRWIGERLQWVAGEEG